SLVWPRLDGLSRDEDDDLQDWKDIQEAADVCQETGHHHFLHEAHHTTATVLHEAGVDSEVIRMLDGHSSMASTRSYLHLSDKRARASPEQIATQLQLTPCAQPQRPPRHESRRRAFVMPDVSCQQGMTSPAPTPWPPPGTTARSARHLQGSTRYAGIHLRPRG